MNKKNILLTLFIAICCLSSAQLQASDDGDRKRNSDKPAAKAPEGSIADELGLTSSRDARNERRTQLDADVAKEIDKIQSLPTWKTDTGKIVERGMQDAIKDRVRREVGQTPEETARERALADIAYAQTMSENNADLIQQQAEQEARVILARSAYLNEHGQGPNDKARRKAEAFIAQQNYLNEHGHSAIDQAIREAQATIAKKQYLRQNRAGWKEQTGDAIQDGVFNGVSQGVSTVVATAIIVPFSKLFGFAWDKTCGCWSYLTTPRDEKILLARMTKLGNDATKLQTDLELKKLEIRMTQTEFTLIEKEKELKALKDQLQTAKEEEKKRLIQEFLASQPQENPYPSVSDFPTPATLPAPPTSPQAAPAA